MARFHVGVESALDPLTAQALRELPDHYHVLVGFNVPRTTRTAEALVLRLAGEQSAMFMVGTAHLHTAVRGTAHGGWEMQTEEDGEWYWDPYETPLGDTNPLLGLQYTANKAQDWIAANLPALEDPLHPWHFDVRPQVFPRLLIVSDQPVEVERHSWVWYFTDQQQLIEHLEAWRPRDPFPITQAVLRNLVAQFNLTPEEAWDDRPAEISVEALRDIQNEWRNLGEEIRVLRDLLTKANDALTAIRGRGRQVDEALRHLTLGIESHPELVDHLRQRDTAAPRRVMREDEDAGGEEVPVAPRKRATKAVIEQGPEDEQIIEVAEAPKPTRKRVAKVAAVPEPEPADDGDDDEPTPPKRGTRKVVAKVAEAPAAKATTTATRGRKRVTEAVIETVSIEEVRRPTGAAASAASSVSKVITSETAPTTPVAASSSAPADPTVAAAEEAAPTASAARGRLRTMASLRPAPLAAEAPAARPALRTISAPAPTPPPAPAEEAEDDEPVDFSAFAPRLSDLLRPSNLGGGSGGGFTERPRFTSPLRDRPMGASGGPGREPMRLLPAAIRGLPHSPSARTADRIERAFKRTMPHFALGPFGFPNFEAFLLSAIEQGIVRGEGGTYWLPDEAPLPPASTDVTAAGALAGRVSPFTEAALISLLSLNEEQQRWLIRTMVEIEQRAEFLTQRYLSRGLTYGRPLFPITEQEAEELVVAARKMRLLEEIEESSDDRPRFTLRVNRQHPVVAAALSGAPLPSLEMHEPVASR